MKKLFVRILLTAILLINFAVSKPVIASDLDQQFQATVLTIVTESEKTEGELSGTIQTLKVRFEEGPEVGQVVTLENDNLNDPRHRAYAVGEQIYVANLAISHGDADTAESEYTVVDEVRQPAIYILMGVFVVLALLVAGKKGVMSLIGLSFSFLVLILVVLPMFINGINPVLVAALAAFLMVFLNFYFSHGFSKKTSIAVVGTLIALTITVLLSLVFIQLGQLTGFASEEAVLLASIKGEAINLKGLILASILIGTIGVLDDVTISQTSIVFELKDAAKSLSFQELYKRAMNVGKDHIASVVNTLVLVYTSGSLPLLLLFVNANNSLHQILNLELVAQEVIITLLSSIGLVLAVPITTFLAAYIVKAQERQIKQQGFDFTK